MRPYTVYLFVTASGSHYRLQAYPNRPTLDGHPTSLCLEKMISLGEHVPVVDDVHVCPSEMWIGDRPVFIGTNPGNHHRAGEYRVTTSTVTYANNAVTCVLD